MEIEEDPAELMRFVLAMRQAGVTDAQALSTMERTPRTHFAPEGMRELAMEDRALPLAHSQSMTKPSLVGRILAALDPQPDEVILEIGTGSGYQAACIARRARRVVTLDRWVDLVTDARERLGRARLLHATAHLADGLAGFAEYAPYDRIVLNGSVQAIPLALREQLKPGGVILAPVGDMLLRLRNGAPEALGPIALAPLTAGLGEGAA